jgi:co-chaperonin GroES (HSP10)
LLPQRNQSRTNKLSRHISQEKLASVNFEETMTKSMFEPHQIQQHQIHPIRDAIICTDMEFQERFTSSGILLPSDNGTSMGVRPRWGRVYAVGPEQTDVAPGQWVCVAHGRWTRGVDIENAQGRLTIRKIDPKDILLVSDEQQIDDTMSDAVTGL